jgi:hypothetical protein
MKASVSAEALRALARDDERRWGANLLPPRAYQTGLSHRRVREQAGKKAPPG